MHQSVIAAGAALWADIGREIPLIVGGLATGVALAGWVVGRRRAAIAARRLDDVEKRFDGPTARDVCGKLAKIITPYRDGRYGKPINDELPPERRFLRNLRVQLRLSRQRRQRIEAMHAENLAECARLRDELETIRRAAEEAADAVARVTRMESNRMPEERAEREEAMPDADTPAQEAESPQKESRPTDIDDAPVASTTDDADAGEDSVEDVETLDDASIADSATAATEVDQPAESQDDEVADLVFSALDDSGADEDASEFVHIDPDALDEVDLPPASMLADESEDEAIDFDSLLVESAHEHCVELPENDASLGGLAAFEKGLSDAGYGAEAIPEESDADESAGQPPADSAIESDDDVAGSAFVDDEAAADIDEALAASAAPEANEASKKNLTPPPSDEAAFDADEIEPEAFDSRDAEIVAEDSLDDLDALVANELADNEPGSDELAPPRVDVTEAESVGTEGTAFEEDSLDDEPPLAEEAEIGTHDVDAADRDDATSADAATMASAGRAKAEIDAAVQRAESSRAALEALDTSLKANLAHRQDMLRRIDSALSERQIQLVTDIMRAEAEHLSLTEALGEIRTSVDALQADISRAVGIAAGPKTDDPDGDRAAE